MAREEILSGIDIGSTTVRVVSAQAKEGDAKQLRVIGAAEAPSEGVSKGAVTSIEDAVSSISSALEKCERMTGIPIEHAFVSVNGAHVVAQPSQGVVAVSKANGEIGEDDVARVLEAAQSIGTPPNYEILHVLPRSFSVDEQHNIKDPVGMTGIKLEVETQIILGQTSHIKNITKTVYRTGVDIDDLVVEILAGAEAVLSKQQKELGVCLVNMGGATTSMMVFEEGEVLHTKILPVGSGHITNDIAIGLRTSVDVAENIKVHHGSALVEEIGKHEEIDLAQYDPHENVIIARREIGEIIYARLEEIFEMIQQELYAIDRFAKLPGGMIFTGGGSTLHGVIPAAKNHFRTSASIGIPNRVQTAIDRVQAPVFSSAIGLVMIGHRMRMSGRRSGFGNFSSVSDVTGRMGKWFRSLMP